jgi:hypothetical protein
MMTEVQEVMNERHTLQLLDFRTGSTASAEGRRDQLCACNVRFWERETVFSPDLR